MDATGDRETLEQLIVQAAQYLSMDGEPVAQWNELQVICALQCSNQPVAASSEEQSAALQASFNAEGSSLSTGLALQSMAAAGGSGTEGAI